MKKNNMLSEISSRGNFKSCFIYKYATIFGDIWNNKLNS